MRVVTFIGMGFMCVVAFLPLCAMNKNIASGDDAWNLWKYQESAFKKHITFHKNQLLLNKDIFNVIDDYCIRQKGSLDVLNDYENDLIQAFPLIKNPVAVLKKIAVLGSSVNSESMKYNLGLCGCRGAGGRLIFILQLLQDIKAKFPDKNKQLVYTDLGEDYGLQTFYFLTSLIDCGYKNIVINIINIGNMGRYVENLGKASKDIVFKDVENVGVKQLHKDDYGLDEYIITHEDVSVTFRGYAGQKNYQKHCKEENALKSNVFVMVDPMFCRDVSYSFKGDNDPLKLKKYVNLSFRNNTEYKPTDSEKSVAISVEVTLSSRKPILFVHQTKDLKTVSVDALSSDLQQLIKIIENRLEAYWDRHKKIITGDNELVNKIFTENIGKWQQFFPSGMEKDNYKNFISRDVTEKLHNLYALSAISSFVLKFLYDKKIKISFDNYPSPSDQSELIQYDDFDDMIRNTRAEKAPIIYILDRNSPLPAQKMKLVGVE